MIQKTSQRQLNAVLASPPRAQADGPEEWGQWIHNKHYSLEVTQHPIRARMCGFGDKDRRPLAPAAVAKMVVRREDNSILDVDDIDVDFYVVTVDLWSADGTQEMNLVLHPSSADRYAPPNAAKSRKRAPPAITPRPPRPSPYPTPHERPLPPASQPPTSPTEFILRPIEPGSTGWTPLLAAVSASYSSNPAYPLPSHDPFSGGADSASPWSYPPALDRTPFQAPTLPSIHSIGRTTPSPNVFPSDPNSLPFGTPDASELGSPFRGWAEVGVGLFDPQNVDPVMRDTGTPRWANDSLMLPGAEAWPSPVPIQQTQHAYQPFGQTPMLPQHTPRPPPPPSPPPQQEEPQQPARNARQQSIPPLPRHSYTRTLVGPLSANAQRLQDEHRQRGIFFLFQDLSIRTEGTFRLRMRLMNVGVPPPPNGFSNTVHTSVSPVLAQIYTEPFTVYSAKRFPGVPDTTALSIAFGNQGQKLPLRNRHGTGKQPRRPPRPGTASSDEE